MVIVGIAAWVLLVVFFVWPMLRESSRENSAEDIPWWVNVANERAMTFLLRGPHITKF
jgi:hypothetical protein